MTMMSAPVRWNTASPRLLPRAAVLSGARLGSAQVSFIDSPAMSFVMDASLAISAGILGNIYNNAGSKWSAFFWSISALGVFKGLIDLSNTINKDE